jgi:ArsR family transcriptional regulator
MKPIESKFDFEVSSWFETFFALQVLTDDGSRIHNSWKKRALQKLPANFHSKFELIGGSPYLWPAIADTLLDKPLTLPFEERLGMFARISPENLKQTIFYGIFHESGPVDHLLSGRYDLFQTVTRLSKAKQDWLAFVGLYPPQKRSPLFRGLECLLRTPKEFRKIAAHLLEIFWEKEFKETWALMLGQLERSKKEKEHLFQSCTLEEFARMALLRVEVDERRGLLKPVRGGYTLPLKNLSRGILLPSAFNDKRHWTSRDKNPKAIVAYFPFFEPSISITRFPPGSGIKAEQAETDPALIFKALGDTTRYAMVSLLAKDPTTSAELARALQLSRPTVSHHIHVLREAGLLEEKVHKNTIQLSIRRDLFENLSELVTNKLFHSAKEINLTKTRSK